MTRASRGLAGVALVAALALTGCTQTAPSDEPATSSDGVEWGDYVATLKADLDKLAAAKDCAELQAQFDTADASSSATLERAGHGNAQLMGYIDDALTGAGCYS